ncbi:MAG: hypothetical protein R6U50_04345 [Desulfobacterales bacterium]
MGIVSVKHAQAHADFIADRTGHHYTAPYIIETDGARVGPKEVVDYVGNVMNRGIDTTFKYADETDPFAFCDSIHPKRRDRSQTVWDVTLQYNTHTADRQDPDQRDWRDGQGNPTRDPFSWRGSMEVGTQLVQVPVWQAWNVDAFPKGTSAGTYFRPENTLGPVVNSAGVVLDPPLMTTVTETILSFALNVPGWDDTYVFVNSNRINTVSLAYSPSVISTFNVNDRTFRPFTVRCSGVQGSYRITTGPDGDPVEYWKAQMEFRIRERASAINPIDGWLESVLDRGLTRGAASGDPDGQGGQYGTGDIEDGMATAAAIRGPDGGRVGEMVLLDGSGQPMNMAEDEAEQTGVYFRWRKHGASTFQYLPANPHHTSTSPSRRPHKSALGQSRSF